MANREFLTEQIHSILDDFSRAISRKTEAEMNAAACRTRADHNRAYVLQDKAAEARDAAVSKLLDLCGAP